MAESSTSATGDGRAAGISSEPRRGLTSAEVAERITAGHVNVTDERSSRTIGEIVRSNVFTRFNAIIAVLAAIILVLGEYRDALFGMVMVLNAVIGIVQEIRSKRTLDRLSLIAAPRMKVWRDGERAELDHRELVLDDVFELSSGDQIPVDAEVLQTDGLSVDESLLTGEADAVPKSAGDGLMSGSFAVAGGGVARATAVGDEAYAARLLAEARVFRAPKSELARGIDRILRVVTWLVVPAAVMLLLAHRFGEDDSWRESLVGSVAGVVALVPQGLVLLLSMAQAVAVIRLGHNNVLVQQLQAVETLARVTMLATDKTGTLTTGTVSLAEVRPLGDADDAHVGTALAAVASSSDHSNATMIAIGAAHPESPGWTVTGQIPFDSAHKFSAVEFDGRGAWYIGAPEVLVGEDHDALRESSALADQGLRVLLLTHTESLAPAGEVPPQLIAMAIVVLSDDIRPDAADTIGYFGREHVSLKVISGDNPRTVSAIAMRCGVPDSDRWVDARTLPAEAEALGETLEETAVFGRVTPHVKRSLVHGAQGRGQVVAMTGDGVNDTLALKDADLGIAMGSGTPAAKSVAELVLLDDRFATLPGVVAEGRRVIANIERVARLFVTKTAWAAVLAVLTGVFTMSYPIVPRQLTVVDALTIGIPGFILSFQPSHEPVRTGFIRRVLKFSLPAGVVVGVVTMSVFALARSDLIGVSREAAQSGATIVLTALGLWVLYELARPLDPIRVVLLAGLVVGGVGAFTIPFIADFFKLEIPPADYAALIAIGVAVGMVAITVAIRVFDNEQTGSIEPDEHDEPDDGDGGDDGDDVQTSTLPTTG